MGSVARLRSNISAAAMGMISTGYVWFVTDSKGNIGIVATYGAGTLLAGARVQKGNPLDIKFRSDPHPVSSDLSLPLSGSSPTSPTTGLSHQPSPMHPSSPSRAFHTSAARQNRDVAQPKSLYSVGSQPPTSFFRDHRSVDFTTLGEVLFPLFNVSIHEHNWVASGYGVWGKERYLTNFWTCLNWKEVSDAYLRFVPDPARHDTM